ncbi:MAG TPA: winged helix-turn-helix domain-containing protein [Blastocatellia bacterium]|nr:winged helix-turn-helix domain-containing protein [Blastocatellia bacterium]
MSKQTKPLYEFGGFRLNAEKQRLLRDGEIVHLTPKAIEMLLLLVKNRGKVVEKDYLMETLWADTIVEESNLTQTVYLLRKALGKDGDGQPFIQTLPKRGYKFAAEVREVRQEGEAEVIGTLTRTRVVIRQEESVEAEDSAAPAQPEPLALPPAPRRQWSGKAIAVTLICIALVGLAVYLIFRNPNPGGTGRRVNSIAVMPFQTVGAEGGEDYLGLGMADALITRLGKTGRIAVLPTDAVRRYTDAEQNSVKAGRALGVEAVLTGNVQQLLDRVRVTVQLVRVADGKAMWADKFDAKFTDIFSLQDLLSERVAEALTLELTGEEKRRLVKNYTQNLEVYQLYLKGRYYWGKRTPEWIRKGIEAFEQALKLDPDYAPAYAGLADSYAITASGLPPQERLPKAKLAKIYHYKEMYAESVAEDLKFRELGGESPETLAALRKAYETDGWQGYWRKGLEVEQAKLRQRFIPLFRMVEMHLRLGENEQALEWIEKSFEGWDDTPLYLKVEPPLDALRADPKFIQLMKRAGFPDR